MLSGIVTAILLGSFLAGTAWAWSARRREEFDLAARLPLDEPPTLAADRDAPRATAGGTP
jgi:cytochrome c oxidase cbb3-type subunit 4